MAQLTEEGETDAGQPEWPIPNISFPGGSASKESTCNAGDLGLIPGLRRSPGEGNGNVLWHSCRENPMD